MAKYSGVIGYAETVEISPGVWIDRIIERNYYIDVLKDTNKLTNSSYSTNDELGIANRFSIISEPYAAEHFHSMRYVEYMGTKWKITYAEVQRPRILLNVGGVYNG